MNSHHRLNWNLMPYKANFDRYATLAGYNINALVMVFILPAAQLFTKSTIHPPIHFLEATRQSTNIPTVHRLTRSKNFILLLKCCNFRARNIYCAVKWHSPRVFVDNSLSKTSAKYLECLSPTHNFLIPDSGLPCTFSHGSGGMGPCTSPIIESSIWLEAKPCSVCQLELLSESSTGLSLKN